MTDYVNYVTFCTFILGLFLSSMRVKNSEELYVLWKIATCCLFVYSAGISIILKLVKMCWFGLV